MSDIPLGGHFKNVKTTRAKTQRVVSFECPCCPLGTMIIWIEGDSVRIEHGILETADDVAAEGEAK